MQQNRWFKRASSLRGPLRALYWSPLVIFMATHWYEVRAISGRSMQPTLNPDWSLSKDHAIFDRVAADRQDCHREDIIILKSVRRLRSMRMSCRPELRHTSSPRSPMNPKHKLIKRIVAEEGDTIRTLPPYPRKEVVVPKGHVWVEGDEPFNSDDSNIFGPISRGLIESKLVCVIWPPERFGTLTKPEKPTTGSPSSPAYRRAMGAWERSTTRQARVTPKVDIDLSQA
ncbi:LexA/Signal peptidase [Coprinellus micaceus]|uniref:Mitochondrial inner membrane protease subunit 2 n=1 Tax=Coprinellus micaceus TaxID=71717 RepID=A0A4Y7T7M9_COPMI|nr:LexA/Signal peptidase [Coprinellus micaceus]